MPYIKESVAGNRDVKALLGCHGKATRNPLEDRVVGTSLKTGI